MIPSLHIDQYSETFVGTPYKDPERKKTKVRSRPLHDLYRFSSKKAREFGQSFLRNYIFYASSPKFKENMDTERLENSRELLREIGGTSLVLENPDGVHIEAMYFDVKQFKETILEKGGHFVRSTNSDSYAIRSHNEELTELLTKMKLPQKTLPFNKTYQEFLIPSSTERAPLLEEKCPGVTISTQGNACIFEMDRGAIADVLLSGQNCIVYNIRGTGRSEGTPTEEGTYQDIETVYQYLKSKGFKDSEITACGYCLGGGQASELAKRHPKINLSLDRTFTSVSEVIGEVGAEMAIEKIEEVPYLKNFSDPIENGLAFPISFLINRFVISYPVEENIKKVRGNIHIADATDDDLIPEGSGDRLFASASPPPSKIKSRMVLEDHEHCSIWEHNYKDKYHDHLNETDILRDFGHTAPSSSSLLEKASTNVNKSTQAVTDVPRDQKLATVIAAVVISSAI